LGATRWKDFTFLARIKTTNKCQFANNIKLSNLCGKLVAVGSQILHPNVQRC
jgi:hypothetical protein